MILITIIITDIDIIDKISKKDLPWNILFFPVTGCLLNYLSHWYDFVKLSNAIIYFSIKILALEIKLLKKLIHGGKSELIL